MMLGLSLGDLNRLIEEPGSYTTVGTESNEWKDLLTVKEEGQAIAIEIDWDLQTSDHACHGVRIVDPSENVLTARTDYIISTSYSGARGPRFYLARCSVRPGCKVQVRVTSSAAASTIEGVLFYSPADREAEKADPATNVLNDPEVMSRASVETTLRRLAAILSRRS